MSKVIQLKTGRQRARHDPINDAPHVFAAIKTSAELIGWRMLAANIHKFEEQAHELKAAVECLPDSPKRDGAMKGLTIALDVIRKLLVIRLSEVIKFEGCLA